MKTQNTSEDGVNALGGKEKVLEALSFAAGELQAVHPFSLSITALDEARIIVENWVAPSPTSQPNETQEVANAETLTASEPPHGLDSIV